MVWEEIEGKNAAICFLQVTDSARKLRMSIPVFILLPLIYDFRGTTFITRASVPINAKLRALFLFFLSFILQQM